MSKKDPKRLVIDTSVARSSGRGDAQDDTSRNCRQFFLVIKDDTKHQIVRSNDLELEWSKHQSRFARRWLIAMESKRRVFHAEIPARGKLRHQVQRAARTKMESDAMLKDMLLLEAAFHTDRTIISLDEAVRGYFQRATENIPSLRRIAWVNPAISEETPTDWLRDGAAHERERLLGYKKEENPL